MSRGGIFALRLPANSIGQTPHWGAQTFEFEKAADEISATGGPRLLSPRPYRPRVRILASICKIPDTRKGHPGFCVEVAGFDTVRSIVAARAWSALAARFALTNSGRFCLRQMPHWGTASLLCRGLLVPKSRTMNSDLVFPRMAAFPPVKPSKGSSFPHLAGPDQPLLKWTFCLSG